MALEVDTSSAKEVATKDQEVHCAVKFPIVGIGASAGGLEAFEQFFRASPIDSGMAFVLVQHLDPRRHSLLSEILQRTTTMPIMEAFDQMPVMPNHVYVIPPNRDMGIFHGMLQLSLAEASASGARMTIDRFLRSLAKDQGANAIGIILSGTGTDGTEGLRAIADAGGITVAQEPSTAKYRSMPTSAIKAGCTVLVLPPEKMVCTFMSARGRNAGSLADMPSQIAVNNINHVLMQLRAATGHDFSQYKKSTIIRRIKRRMLQNSIDEMQLYARFLRRHVTEAQLLMKELLINVTSFFRDPEAFVTLKTIILPQLFADKPDDYVFRVWVAGCASGEEAYTIAIVLRECMEETGKKFKVQIYSTDLDDEAIVTARAGFYPATIAQNVSPERLQRFFTAENGGFRVRRELREMVIFAVQNVLQDPPFTNLDLLSCRNLLIYFEPELQKHLIPLFHYAIKPGGVLFLSPSESIGNFIELFAPINRKWKFYQAMPHAAANRAVRTNALTYNEQDSTKEGDEVMRKDIDNDAAEDVKIPLPSSAVAVPPLLLSEVKSTATTSREFTIKPDDTDSKAVSFNVRLQPDPAAAGGMRVIFQDVADVASHKDEGNVETDGANVRQRFAALEQDLADTKENLQATIEEQLTSNEDLKSANEEMQSTNEELETSKEELESLNEQLVTANAELQSKIKQLADIQNDMNSLLDNISVGAIFLGRDLRIRRFTPAAVQAYHLVATDVGRSLSNIKSNLVGGDDLLGAAQKVLDSRQPFERELRAVGGNGWFLARIQSYVAPDKKIDGVVLTFTDVGERIRAVAAETAKELAAGTANVVDEPLIVFDDEFTVVSVSNAFCQAFKLASQDIVGLQLHDLCNQRWNFPSLYELLKNIKPDDHHAAEATVSEHEFPEIGHRKERISARRVAGKAGGPELTFVTMETML